MIYKYRKIFALLLLIISLAACTKKKDELTTEDKSKLSLLTNAKWQLTRFTHQEYDEASVMTEDVDYIDSFSECERNVLYSFGKGGVFGRAFDFKVCDSLIDYDYFLQFDNWVITSDSSKINFDNSANEKDFWKIDELSATKLTIHQDHYGGVYLFKSIRSFKKVK